MHTNHFALFIVLTISIKCSCPFRLMLKYIFSSTVLRSNFSGIRIYFSTFEREILYFSLLYTYLIPLVTSTLQI